MDTGFRQYLEKTQDSREWENKYQEAVAKLREKEKLILLLKEKQKNTVEVLQQAQTWKSRAADERLGRQAAERTTNKLRKEQEEMQKALKETQAQLSAMQEQLTALHRSVDTLQQSMQGRGANAAQGISQAATLAPEAVAQIVAALQAGLGGAGGLGGVRAGAAPVPLLGASAQQQVQNQQQQGGTRHKGRTANKTDKAVGGRTTRQQPAAAAAPEEEQPQQQRRIEPREVTSPQKKRPAADAPPKPPSVWKKRAAAATTSEEQEAGMNQHPSRAEEAEAAATSPPAAKKRKKGAAKPTPAAPLPPFEPFMSEAEALAMPPAIHSLFAVLQKFDVPTTLIHIEAEQDPAATGPDLVASYVERLSESLASQVEMSSDVHQEVAAALGQGIVQGSCTRTEVVNGLHHAVLSHAAPVFEVNPPSNEDHAPVPFAQHWYQGDSPRARFTALAGCAVAVDRHLPDPPKKKQAKHAGIGELLITRLHRQVLSSFVYSDTRCTETELCAGAAALGALCKLKGQDTQPLEAFIFDLLIASSGQEASALPPITAALEQFQEALPTWSQCSDTSQAKTVITLLQQVCKRAVREHETSSGAAGGLMEGGPSSADALLLANYHPEVAARHLMDLGTKVWGWPAGDRLLLLSEKDMARLRTKMQLYLGT